MTVSQYLTYTRYLCIYELSVLFTLQAAILTHQASISQSQPSILLPQLYKTASFSQKNTETFQTQSGLRLTHPDAGTQQSYKKNNLTPQIHLDRSMTQASGLTNSQVAPVMTRSHVHPSMAQSSGSTGTHVDLSMTQLKSLTRPHVEPSKIQASSLTRSHADPMKQVSSLSRSHLHSSITQASSLTRTYPDLSMTKASSLTRSHQDPSMTQTAILTRSHMTQASSLTRSYPGSSMIHRTNQGRKFSMTHLMDSFTLPPLPAVFTGGATKCQAFKSFFGLTYEQMLEKNLTKFHEIMTIDLITKDGNEKYNFSSTRRLTKNLKEAKEIIVLVHGFLESSDGAMVQALAAEYLKKPGLEILALDGRKVINLEYFRSTTYARFMGEKLGQELSEIVKEDIDPGKFTLVGHSLGAHIAGIAGMRVFQLVGKRVGRVIGLDPAGPCFANISPDNRLDKSDAEFVEVLHTNAGILGINEAVGHKDFFPSGGKSQPDCILSTCDHSRAWQIFAESINSPDNFPARKCSNWTAFKDGLCVKNEVAYLGASSDKGSPGLYFMNVASAPPYGLGATGSG